MQRPWPSGYRTGSLCGLRLITVTHEETKVHYHELRFFSGGCSSLLLSNVNRYARTRDVGFAQRAHLEGFVAPHALVSQPGKSSSVWKNGMVGHVNENFENGEAGIFIYS